MSYARGTQQNSDRSYPYFCCWRYSKGFHNGGGHIISRRCEEALFSSLQEFVDCGHSNITYTVEHTSDTSDTDISRYEKQLKKLAIRENRAKEAYLDGIDTKEEYRNNRNMIQNEISSIQEKIRLLSNQADVVESEEIHVDIEEIISKLKDETVSTLEKHTALASVLERMEYDKERDEFFFYYLFD